MDTRPARPARLGDTIGPRARRLPFRPRHSPTSLQTVLGARGATGTYTLDSFAHHRGRDPRADDDTRPGARLGRHRCDRLQLLPDRLLGRRDCPFERRDIPLARRNCLRCRRDLLRLT